MVTALRSAMVLACSWLLACVHHYEPPRADQPHGILKVRRVYEQSAGTHYRESSRINEHVAYEDTLSVGASGAPANDALLVHPRTARFRQTATFFHREMRTVQESYLVQVPYTTTESYSCGFGKYPQTCTRSVTQYRSETRWRTVTKLVDVVDADCTASVWITPEVAHTYLLDFTYRENGVCSLRCLEQLPGEGGTFRTQPCLVPTKEQADASAED